jgi:hypothetical protein
MDYKYKFIIGIIISVILLLTGGYLLLNEVKKDSGGIPQPVENSGSVEIPQLTENIELSSKSYSGNYTNVTGIIAMSNISFDEIPHNTKPQFKVGDKFEYLSSSVGVNEKGSVDFDKLTQKITYSVLKTEKVSGIECYVIESIDILTLKESDPKSRGSTTRTLSYIDAETGKTIMFAIDIVRINDGIETNTKHQADIPSDISEAYSMIFGYYPWMLSLNDEFKMEIRTFRGGKIEKEILKVIEKDKIKNRECYKLEYRRIDENNEVMIREIQWIDSKKRILVKKETYLRNLKVNDAELVSELK